MSVRKASGASWHVLDLGVACPRATTPHANMSSSQLVERYRPIVEEIEKSCAKTIHIAVVKGILELWNARS
jgi:hypothetical protein